MANEADRIVLKPSRFRRDSDMTLTTPPAPEAFWGRCVPYLAG